MKKSIFQSKTVIGFIGFALFGILNIYYPNTELTALTLASLGWAGYGFRDAMS